MGIYRDPTVTLETAIRQSRWPVAYVITLKNGARFHCAEDGSVIYDGDRCMGFSADGSWRILGVTTRYNSRHLITLADAASGFEPIGQGWVHDYDHGHHRMWAMPSNRRAVKIERVTLG